MSLFVFKEIDSCDLYLFYNVCQKTNPCDLYLCLYLFKSLVLLLMILFYLCLNHRDSYLCLYLVLNHYDPYLGLYLCLKRLTLVILTLVFMEPVLTMQILPKKSSVSVSVVGQENTVINVCI